MRSSASALLRAIADLKVRATYVKYEPRIRATAAVRGEKPPRHAAHAKRDKSPNARLRPTTTATSVRGHRAVVVFKRKETDVRALARFDRRAEAALSPRMAAVASGVAAESVAGGGPTAPHYTRSRT